MKTELNQKHCEACEGIVNVLTLEQINNLLPQLHPNWEVTNDHKQIKRQLKFANFYETMACVNAIAWIANVENHHPDLEIGYNYCNISFMTHALNGLSHNDFICASKVDALFK